MIHARDDYNQEDLDMKIPKDEPVFLLRAQDVTAAAVVRYWASLQSREDGNSVLVEMALGHANLMDDWPVKKIADL